MILVLAMMAAMWGIGWAMGAPVRARWTMIGVLLTAVLVVQIALPDGHPVRQATGSDPRFWLMILAFAGLVLGYRAGLRQLRARAQAFCMQGKSAATATGYWHC